MMKGRICRRRAIATALASEIYDELMPTFSPDGRFDPEALAVLGRSFVEMKTLPQQPDISKLLTEAFLP